MHPPERVSKLLPRHESLVRHHERRGSPRAESPGCDSLGEASRRAQAQVNVLKNISKTCKAATRGHLGGPGLSLRWSFPRHWCWGCALRGPPLAVTSPAFSLEHRRRGKIHSTGDSEEPNLPVQLLHADGAGAGFESYHFPMTFGGIVASTSSPHPSSIPNGGEGAQRAGEEALIGEATGYHLEMGSVPAARWKVTIRNVIFGHASRSSRSPRRWTLVWRGRDGRR